MTRQDEHDENSRTDLNRRDFLRTATVAGVGTSGVVALSGSAAAETLSVPGDYSTIQDAVDNASAGDTVDIDAGTYDESVTVDVEDLTLKGPNAGSAGDDSREDEAVVEGRVVVSANGVTVDGINVSSPPDPEDDTTKGEAVRVSSSADDVSIINNIVEDFARTEGGDFFGVDGINLFGGDGDPVKDATVQDNLVRQLQNTISGGAAGISVQGNVVNATVEDNTVKKIGQEATSYGFGVVIRGTGNTSEVPTDTTVSKNSISEVLSDPGSDFAGVGVGVEASGADEVTFENNDIEDTERLLEDKTATVDLTKFAENNTLDRGALIEQAAFNSPRNVIFNSVGDALDRVPTDATVNLLSGTYDESVTISDTSGLTISGPNADLAGDNNARGEEAIIEGQVDISAQDTTVEGLQVTPGTETFNSTPAAGIIIFESNATVQNNRVADFNISITDIEASSIQSIQIYEAGTELTGTEVRNNSVESITYQGSENGLDGSFGDDYGNLYGIHVQGKIGDAVIADNTLRDLTSDGYTFASAVSGTSSNEDASSKNVEIRSNTYENLSAEGAPATGLVISGGAVDTDNVSLVENSFDVPVGVANGDDETTLDAIGNWWGDASGPSSVDTGANTVGDVAFTPWLVREPLPEKTLIDAVGGLEDQVVFAAGTLRTTSNNGEAVTDYSQSKISAIGDSLVDFESEQTGDIVFLTTSGEINLIDVENSSASARTISPSPKPKTNRTHLATGRFDGSATSVFYVADGAIYRVNPDETSTRVANPDNGVSAVAGVGDIDGDGDTELAFADGSQQLRYVEAGDDETQTFTKVPNGGMGSNNSVGVGAPADFTGDGTADVPVVDGSNQLRLLGHDGVRERLTTGNDNEQAAKSPVCANDVDGDGELELVYLENNNSPAELKYVDDIGGGNEPKLLEDESGEPIEGDTALGVTALNQEL